MTASQTNEQKYRDFIATVDPSCREAIDADAQDNAFTSDPAINAINMNERWGVALATAKMMADAPADFGFAA